MKKTENIARLNLIGAMVIFGTIGIFRKYIPMSSSFIAMARGFIGVLFLILVLALRRQKPSWAAIRENVWLLLISGGLIGFNWILLFEAYNHTSVATATLCYYMAPIFVTLAAPFVLRERLTVRKLLLSLVALAGMVLVSDVLNVGVENEKIMIRVLNAEKLWQKVFIISVDIGSVILKIPSHIVVKNLLGDIARLVIIKKGKQLNI